MEILSGASASSGPVFHEISGAGTTRYQIQPCIPAAIINVDELGAAIGENILVSGVSLDVSVDGLEGIGQTTNDHLASGLAIRDGDGTALADVVATSGGNGLMVQLDNALTVGNLLTSGTIDASDYSAGLPIDLKGYYNNALFIGSSVTGDVNIFANSDGGSLYAKVKTLTFDSANTYLYYDLKGYEASIQIQPMTSGDYFIDLIKAR